jgi:hypothetical protein
MMQEALNEMMRNTQRIREAMEAEMREKQQLQQQQQQVQQPEQQPPTPSAHASSAHQTPPQKLPEQGDQAAASAAAPTQPPSIAAGQGAAPAPSNGEAPKSDSSPSAKRVAITDPTLIAKMQAAQALHEEMVTMFRSKAQGSKAERNAIAAVRDAAASNNAEQLSAPTPANEEDAASDDEESSDDGMAAWREETVNGSAEAGLTAASTQLPVQQSASVPGTIIPEEESEGLPRLGTRRVSFSINGPPVDWANLKSKVSQWNCIAAIVGVVEYLMMIGARQANGCAHDHTGRTWIAAHEAELQVSHMVWLLDVLTLKPR